MANTPPVTSLKQLTKVEVPTLPDWINTVGIAGPVNMGGEIVTKEAGNGDGIFNKVVNAVETVWSTYQQSTKASTTAPVEKISETRTTYGDDPKPESESDDTILWVGGLLVAGKLLNVF